MPITIPRNLEMERRARELYRPGVFGYKQVAARLGCSVSSVRRYVSDERRARDQARGRANKAKRTGICERCGGPTKYNGRTNNGPSSICAECNEKPWTHCINGHLLTPENLLPSTQARRCRLCRNAYAREYRRKKLGRAVRDYRRPVEEMLLAAVRE